MLISLHLCLMASYTCYSLQRIYVVATALFTCYTLIILLPLYYIVSKPINYNTLYHVQSPM